MKKKHLLPIVLLGVMSSCADKEENEPMKNVEEQEGSFYRISSLKSTSHTISMEEAERNAKEAMAMLCSEGNSLKNASVNKVDNVIVIHTPKSRLKSANSSIPDTLAYVVNFADSAGFALVSADDRVPYQVLACLDNGSYSEDNDNPNLNYMMAMSQQYIQNSIIDFEANKEACLSFLETSDEPQTTTNQLKSSYTEIKGPYVTTKWGQGSPYNGLVKCTKEAGCTKNAVTGCCPTALAQLMTYYEWPAKRFPWALLKNENNVNQRIARLVYTQQLMAWIGNELGAEYGHSSTSAGIPFYVSNNESINNTSPWLTEQGYDNKKYAYSWNTLKGLLDKGPVLMQGDRDGGGHAWVTDGYKHIHYTIPIVYSTPAGKKTTTANADIYFAHHNWGWDGKNNGYFLKDCFDVANASQFDNTSISNDQKYNYYMNLEIIKMVPKK